MRQPNRYSELDFQLHTKIVEAMENPIYLSLYQSISDLLLEEPAAHGGHCDSPRQAHQDHVAIVGALRARDPEARPGDAGAPRHTATSARRHVGPAGAPVTS